MVDTFLCSRSDVDSSVRGSRFECSEGYLELCFGFPIDLIHTPVHGLSQLVHQCQADAGAPGLAGELVLRALE
jgi:hypothetical protein